MISCNNFNYIYVYMYNILSNFDIYFVDINFIKSNVHKSTSPLKCSIQISLHDLGNNIISYGTFFPFFYKKNGKLVSGNHRLFVLQNIKCNCFRLFPIIQLKKQKCYNLILPIKTEDLNMYSKYNMYNKDLFLKEYSKIYMLKDYGYIKIKTQDERLKCALIHFSGSEISYSIYKYYHDKNLDIISKHPIINCKTYYKKYKVKCFIQIKYRIFQDNIAWK